MVRKEYQEKIKNVENCKKSLNFLVSQLQLSKELLTALQSGEIKITYDIKRDLSNVLWVEKEEITKKTIDVKLEKLKKKVEDLELKIEETTVESQKLEKSKETFHTNYISKIEDYDKIRKNGVYSSRWKTTWGLKNSEDYKQWNITLIPNQFVEYQQEAIKWYSWFARVQKVVSHPDQYIQVEQKYLEEVTSYHTDNKKKQSHQKNLRNTKIPLLHVDFWNPSVLKLLKDFKIRAINKDYTYTHKAYLDSKNTLPKHLKDDGIKLLKTLRHTMPFKNWEHTNERVRIITTWEHAWKIIVDRSEQLYNPNKKLPLRKSTLSIYDTVHDFRRSQDHIIIKELVHEHELDSLIQSLEEIRWDITDQEIWSILAKITWRKNHYLGKVAKERLIKYLKSSNKSVKSSLLDGSINDLHKRQKNVQAIWRNVSSQLIPVNEAYIKQYMQRKKQLSKYKKQMEKHFNWKRDLNQNYAHMRFVEFNKFIKKEKISKVSPYSNYTQQWNAIFAQEWKKYPFWKEIDKEKTDANKMYQFHILFILQGLVDRSIQAKNRFKKSLDRKERKEGKISSYDFPVEIQRLKEKTIGYLKKYYNEDQIDMISFEFQEKLMKIDELQKTYEAKEFLSTKDIKKFDELFNSLFDIDFVDILKSTQIKLVTDPTD